MSEREHAGCASINESTRADSPIKKVLGIPPRTNSCEMCSSSFPSYSLTTLGLKKPGQVNTGAKPGLWLGKDALRFADPIVSDRKLPIRSGNIKCNGDLPVFCIFAECMLYRIDNELRDDQSEALGITEPKEWARCLAKQSWSKIRQVLVCEMTLCAISDRCTAANSISIRSPRAITVTGGLLIHLRNRPANQPTMHELTSSHFQCAGL